MDGAVVGLLVGDEMQPVLGVSVLKLGQPVPRASGSRGSCASSDSTRATASSSSAWTVVSVSM